MLVLLSEKLSRYRNKLKQQHSTGQKAGQNMDQMQDKMWAQCSTNYGKNAAQNMDKVQDKTWTKCSTNMSKWMSYTEQKTGNNNIKITTTTTTTGSSMRHLLSRTINLKEADLGSWWGNRVYCQQYKCAHYTESGNRSMILNLSCILSGHHK